MINVGHKILTAWFELLNGNISVPVYRTDVPESETGNYVRLRIESINDQRNNHAFVSRPVVISEVVTRHGTMINDKLVYDIDSEVGALVFPTPATHALPAQADIQIVDVKRQNVTVLPEDDDSGRYLRLITRNIHYVVETGYELGPEEIVNGSFAGSATGWQLGDGWTYNTNKVKFANIIGVSDVKQGGLLVTDARYRLSFMISGSNGYVLARMASGDSQVFYANEGGVAFEGRWRGTFEGFKAAFTPSANFDGNITNVSMKQIL